MEKKLKNFFLNYKNILLTFLFLKIVLTEEKKANEIALIVNNAKTNIINISYYFFISEIIVNNNSAPTNNYINLLTKAKNNIIIKFKTPLTSCINMFTDLKNILYVDISSFDSSKTKNMYKMFSGCTSLKSLNVTNLDTSSVTNMCEMFSNCKSLISINLVNLNLTSDE